MLRLRVTEGRIYIIFSLGVTGTRNEIQTDLFVGAYVRSIKDLITYVMYNAWQWDDFVICTGTLFCR